VLPVLALDLQPGDAVLDMCAAPGGKTLSILQTLMPNIMIANDIQTSRVNRINKVINQYVAGIGQWENRLCVTERDARFIDDKDMYNKVIQKRYAQKIDFFRKIFVIIIFLQILVDVPCTTDRHVLHSEENNIFKPQRIQERLKIPELQAAILTYKIRYFIINMSPYSSL